MDKIEYSIINLLGLISLTAGIWGLHGWQHAAIADGCILIAVNLLHLAILRR